MTFLVRDTSVNQLGFKAHKSLVVYVHSGKGVGHYVIMRRILHYVVVTGFWKISPNSHFTTHIFIDQIRNKDFQSTLHWLQFVVHTLNYHNLM